MARKIVITSGKGGVGKTTISFLLGRELSKMGNRVVILDVDIGLNNLDVVSGVEKKVVFDIVDVAKQKCRKEQALTEVDGCFNLYIMPSAHPNNVGKVDVAEFKSVVESLERGFDFLIIDCPAGIDYGFLRAVCLASEAIIVSTPHISALRDAAKVSEILSSFNLSSVSLIINRNIEDFVRSKKQLNPFEIAKTLELNLLGVVDENKDILVVSSLNGDLNGVEESGLLDIKNIAKNVFNGQFLQKNVKSFSFGD